jgi:hypothetical protein
MRVIGTRGLRGSLRAMRGVVAIALGLSAAVGFLAMWPSGARSEIHPTGRPPALPDLAVLVDWSKFRVLVGGSLSFQVLVTNDGSPPLGPVPAGAVVRVSITNGTITGINTVNSGFICPAENRSPSQAVCRRDTPMAPGTAVTFTVGVQAPPQPGTITATATASLPTSLPDRNPSNNSSTRDAQVYPALIPDLTVSIAGLPDPVVGLSDVAYSLDVTNAGSGDATGVTVRHTLPAGATFKSAGSGCTHASGVVICALGTVPAGMLTHVNIVSRAPLGPGSLVYAAAIDPVAGEQSTINNSASATRANVGPPDLIPNVTGSSWVLHTECHRLSIAPMGCVTSGVTLRLSVKNKGTGPAPATNLRVEILSSSAARFVSDELCAQGYRFIDGTCTYQDSAASCSHSQGSVATCSTPSLAAGATSGQFVVSAGLMVSGGNFPITFLVRADADGAVTESNENNNILPLTVTVP